MMIELQCSLVIEATKEQDCFTFHSFDLKGLSGVWHSIEDCVYNAKWGMLEHIEFLKKQGLTVPAKNPDPRVVIQNDRNLVVL